MSDDLAVTQVAQTDKLTLTHVIGKVRSVLARHQEAVDDERGWAMREHHRGAVSALEPLLGWLEGFQPPRGTVVIERAQDMAYGDAKRVTLLAHIEVAHCEGPFLPKRLLAEDIVHDLLLHETLEPKSRRADGTPVGPWSSYWVERVRISAPRMEAVIGLEDPVLPDEEAS